MREEQKGAVKKQYRPYFYYCAADIDTGCLAY